MYHLLYGILYLFSLLPFWLIYAISDGIAWVLDRVVGYRKNVIFRNLDIVFPEKSLPEKKQIASAFYHRFTDTFLEAIKALSMSETTFKKRVRFEMAAFKEPIAAGKNIQVDSLHQMNWEYGSLAASLNLPIPFLAVYRKLDSTAADRLFLKIRSRFGAVMTETAELSQQMIDYKNQPHAIGLIADQSSAKLDRAFWLNLFGKPTSFLPGIEITAQRNNLAVIFTRMVPQNKRGYYVVENRLISMGAQEFQKGELLRLFRDFVEESIRNYPAYYLWSHQRFKRRFRPEHAKNWIDATPAPEICE